MQCFSRARCRRGVKCRRTECRQYERARFIADLTLERAWEKLFTGTGSEANAEFLKKACDGWISLRKSGERYELYDAKDNRVVASWWLS